MIIFRQWSLFFFIFHSTTIIKAATHWIVTEKGMIQSQVASPLNLRRPYDLIALIDQEKRWDEIQIVLDDLMIRKSSIEEKWTSFQGSSEMQSKLIGKKPDCFVDVPIVDVLSHIATNGSERIKVDINYNNNINEYYVPDCIKYHGYEPKLDKVNLWNLPPEYGLEKLMPVESVKQFGHEIHRELVKNSTSWVGYNLGSLYWRIKGNGQKALDCNRRALHFVPDEYRDIPLHNFAGILHKAGLYAEAIEMLLLAIETAPKQGLHYLALGHMYLIIGDYNNSIHIYDQYLALKPDNNAVNSVKKAVVCLSRLETYLVDFQENVLGNLQGILTDLHDFRNLQQHGLRLNKRLLWEQSSYDGNVKGEVTIEGLIELGLKTHQSCVKNSRLSCGLTEPIISDYDTLNLQNLFQLVEGQMSTLSDKLTATKALNYDLKKKKIEPEKFVKFPPTSTKQYFDANGWPSEEECTKWGLKVGEKDDLQIPVFLPPENRGFDVVNILGASIGLTSESEHALPWHPPNCDQNSSGEKFIQQSEIHYLNAEIKTSDYLKNHFLKYVNNGRSNEAEIGQRIITAIEQKTAPPFVLSTLASLYWQIRGNSHKMLDCLDQALKSAPKDQTDVVLVLIASTLNQLGLKSQSMKYANLAFKVNVVEPSTNFLLALLHYQTNPLLAVYHMKNVLRVDSGYYNGLAESLVKKWSCRIKLAPVNEEEGENGVQQNVCAEKEAFKGQGMVCSANGNECKTASIQCFHTKTLEGSGDLEPDQSQLERISNLQPPFHVKLFLPDDNSPEFYVGFSDDSTSETTLHVYDKSGTYSLSPKVCKEIIDADWVHFTSMWLSVAARNIDITSMLKPITKSKSLKPYCSDGDLNPTFATLNYLTNVLLRNKLPYVPDETITEWLGIIAGDQSATIEMLATKIGLALQENSTSWLLASAAALYWRVVGNAEEAIVCLRLALNHVPDDMRDVPLISLANILQKIGYNDDALEVALSALKNNPNFVVNHFTVGNILTQRGNLEEAITFHRSALAIDGSFEPARNRLQAILCTLLFDENGALRNNYS